MSWKTARLIQGYFNRCQLYLKSTFSSGKGRVHWSAEKEIIMRYVFYPTYLDDKTLGSITNMHWMCIKPVTPYHNHEILWIHELISSMLAIMLQFKWLCYSSTLFMPFHCKPMSNIIFMAPYQYKWVCFTSTPTLYWSVFLPWHWGGGGGGEWCSITGCGSSVTCIHLSSL